MYMAAWELRFEIMINTSISDTLMQHVMTCNSQYLK